MVTQVCKAIIFKSNSFQMSSIAQNHLHLISLPRLTHSYFRREGFRFGAREDWRFEDMRKKDPENFWWQSFVSSLLIICIRIIFLCIYYSLYNYLTYAITHFPSLPTQFLAYLSQHLLLVGITLPLWAVNFFPGREFGFPDYLSLGCCMVGLMVSNVADRQLRIFMVR